MTRISLYLVTAVFVLTLAGCSSGFKPDMFTAHSFVCQDLASAKQVAWQSYNCCWKEHQLQVVLFSYHARAFWRDTEFKDCPKHLPKVLDLSLAKPGDYVALPVGCGNQITDRNMTLAFPDGKQYIALCVWNDEDWLDDATMMVITDVRPVAAAGNKLSTASSAVSKNLSCPTPPGPPIKAVGVTIWRADGNIIRETLLLSTDTKLDGFLAYGAAEIPLHGCRPFLLRGGEKARITDNGTSYLGTVSIRRPGTTSLFLNNFRKENKPQTGQ